VEMPAEQSSKDIVFSKQGAVGVVTIQRPEAGNALTREMWQELYEIGRKLHEDKNIRSVLFEGTAGAFTAGSDIREFSRMTIEEADEAFRTMEKTIRCFETLPKPIIAAVDGPVFGAGFIFSLRFDYTIGTAGARMGIPVARLGIRLGAAFLRRIEKALGTKQVRALVAGSHIYNAEEARQLGLLQEIVPERQLREKASAKAEEAARVSPGTLEVLNRWMDETTDDQFLYADPEDFHEGCLAFIEKREPRFPSVYS
jgi:enoyl-CoA hydratase